jgi:hypothetical protein
MSQATAYEQLMLELINAERAKVGAQPLASQGDLNGAAETHSRWMIEAEVFSHTGAGGSTPTQRMTDAGYDFSGSWSSAENIAWASLRDPSGYDDELQLLHTNLMNSPGHRTNLLNPAYREIGIGFEIGEYQGWQAAFVTQNFTQSGTGSFVTGVAYRDKDGDGLYDPGEALAGLSVSAVSAANLTYTAQTKSAGGYDLALPTGTYTVTFSGSGIAPVTQQVTIGATNVKLDLKNPAAASGVSDPASGAAVNLVTGTGASNTLKGTSGADRIQGLAGKDKVYGYSGNDRLDGGTGNDTLSGSSGNDTLLGRSGSDVLFGGAGRDTLHGGPSADRFQFRGQWGADTVADFQDEYDKLDLRGTGLAYSSLMIGAVDADRDGRTDDIAIHANGQSIALLNMRAALVGASDFLF